MQHRISIVRAVLLVIVAMVSLFTASGVRGQFVTRLLQEPLDSAWMNDGLTLLDPTWEQRIAIEQLHEDYKRRYQSYRDGKIMSFGRKLLAIQGNLPELPSLDEIESLIDERTRIVTELTQMEQELLNAIALELREDQQPKLNRLRLLRERDRHLGFVLFASMDFNRVDLIRIVEDFDLAPDAQQRADQSLLQYERELTTALRSIEKAMNELLELLIESLEKAGYDDLRKQNLELEQMARVFQPIAMELQEQQQELEEKMQALKRVSDRYAKLVEQSLPVEVQNTFSRRYHERANPEVYNDPESPAITFENALASDSFDEETVRQLNMLHATWDARWQGLTSQMARTWSDLRDRSGNHDTSELWTRMNELREQRRKVNQETNEKLTELLGGQVVARLRVRTSANNVAGNSPRGAQGAAIAAQPLQASEASYGRIQRGQDGTALPPHIRLHEFSFYARRLGLDENQQVVARAFYDDYRTEFEKTARQILIEDIRPASEKAYNQDNPNYAALAKALETARRDGFKALVEVDERFFQSIEALLIDQPEERMNAIRTARACVRLNVLGVSDYIRRDQHASVPGILAGIDLPEHDFRTVEPVLHAYEQQLVEELQTLYDAFLSLQTAQITASRLWQENQGEMSPQEISAKYQEIIGDAQRSVQAIGLRCFELQQAFVDDLRMTLSPEGMYAFETVYRRIAYPDVYPDRENAGPVVERALSARNLPDNVVNGLQQVLERHQREHESLCIQMVEQVERYGSPPQFSEENMDAMAEWQLYRERIGMMRFDRTELNETTRRAARALLTEEQAKTISGLMAAPRDTSNILFDL